MKKLILFNVQINIKLLFIIELEKIF
jgi:hypothetical protein